MVAALVALCKREGDYKDVADKSGISPDNLWQIINGTKLPSGNPRGVGPKLRLKITAAYPDWLSPTLAAQIPNDAAGGAAVAVLAAPAVATLGQTLERLASYFEMMDASTRSIAISLLGQLADNPQDHARIAAMIDLSIASKNPRRA